MQDDCRWCQVTQSLPVTGPPAVGEWSTALHWTGQGGMGPCTVFGRLRSTIIASGLSIWVRRLSERPGEVPQVLGAAGGLLPPAALRRRRVGGLPAPGSEYWVPLSARCVSGAGQRQASQPSPTVCTQPATHRASHPQPPMRDPLQRPRTVTTTQPARGKIAQCTTPGPSLRLCRCCVSKPSEQASNWPAPRPLCIDNNPKVETWTNRMAMDEQHMADGGWHLISGISSCICVPTVRSAMSALSTLATHHCRPTDHMWCQREGGPT